MDTVQKTFGALTGVDPQAAAKTARQAKFTAQVTKLQEQAALKQQAEAEGALASIRNRPRLAFLSQAGFSGLRRRLGGPQSA